MCGYRSRARAPRWCSRYRRCVLACCGSGLPTLWLRPSGGRFTTPDVRHGSGFGVTAPPAPHAITQNRQRRDARIRNKWIATRLTATRKRGNRLWRVNAQCMICRHQRPRDRAHGRVSCGETANYDRAASRDSRTRRSQSRISGGLATTPPAWEVKATVVDFAKIVQHQARANLFGLHHHVQEWGTTRPMRRHAAHRWQNQTPRASQQSPDRNGGVLLRQDQLSCTGDA